MARGYLAPDTISGRAYLAPDVAPAVIVPPAQANVDASTVPASRTVAFPGGVRTVAFPGGTRVVVFGNPK